MALLKRTPRAEPLPERVEIALGERIVPVRLRANPNARRYTLRLGRGTAEPVVTVPRGGNLGDARSFLLVRGRAEARGDRTKRAWDGVAVTGRVAMYAKPSAERTRIATFDVSAVHQSVYPVQLTFRDSDGGLPGYDAATLAGGRRIVARIEERRLVRPIGDRADVALGMFGAVGMMQAGDVPFGTNTGVLGSAGVSVFAAYPAGGKRTYRLDAAFPFDPVRARTHVELRFTVSARAGSAWMEPRDVAHARSGAVPVSLMR